MNFWFSKKPAQKTDGTIAPETLLAPSSPTSNTQELSADHPVAKSSEDRFQRYPFARRVAQTILQRTAQECIVFGIYGPWGDGKTSVINFIQTELAASKQMLTLTFNPWRYTGEEDLLKQFFQKVSGTLQKGLHTKGEIVGQFLGKYARFLDFDIPVLGNVKDKVEGVGELLSESDVETLKTRVGEIIRENGKKLVIFIDDIDRLDKTEVHAIFRLVKLTADFPNVIYVLAFDDQMVASAIGERFGAGDRASGREFLEKIIQVPLRIPPASDDALQNFCLDQINKVLQNNGIELHENQKQRLSTIFPVTLLASIDTPRLAVRYGNAVAFSVPLLKGEVDMVDLILLEGMKVLFPRHYASIVDNIDLYMGGRGHQDNAIGNERYQEFSGLLRSLHEGFSRSEVLGVERLIKDLFPRAKQVLENDTQSDPPVTAERRVQDPAYFFRYFSYTILPGDLPDAGFQQFIDLMKAKDTVQALTSLRALIVQSSARQVITKVRRESADFAAIPEEDIALLFCKNGDLFSTEGINYYIQGERDPRKQLVIFVVDTIRQRNVGKQFEGAMQLITEASDIQLAMAIFSSLNKEETNKPSHFDKKQMAELFFQIRDRVLKEAGDLPFWEVEKENANDILALWEDFDHDSTSDYVSSRLRDASDARIFSLLEAVLPIHYSSTHPEKIYKGNLRRVDFQLLERLVNVEDIVTALYKRFGKELDNEKPIKRNEKEGPFQDDLNIAKQFMNWYGLFDENEDKGAEN